MKTFSGEPQMGLSDIGQAIHAAGVIVWSIRPPQNRTEGWTVNFRQRDRETAWEFGKPKATLEEAMTDALERLEKLVSVRVISHASIGRSVFKGNNRFATLEGVERDNYRGKGDTVEEALTDALDQAEKEIFGKGGGGVSKAKAQQAKPAAPPPEDDPLDDLLG